MPNMSLVQLDNLSKRYTPDGAPAVDGLSLRVEADEVFALVGPSGSGKTTALRMIAGFESPDAGTIAIGDELVEGPGVHVRPERRQVGLVFQELALFPHLDVLRNVTFGLQGVPRGARRARATEVLEWVGMSAYAARRPHELSGGQQQRVALARSIAPAPRIILLDEPFNSLDAAWRADVRAQVRSVLKEHGMSALLVTHDQEEALSFADRIGVMNEGRLLQVGAPAEVYHEPATAFVARFLGRTNLVEGTPTDDPRRVRTPLGTLWVNRDCAGDVLLSVRPEHLRLVPPRDDATAGRVVQREFKGHDLTLEVELDGRRYTVQTGYACAFGEGDAVSIEHVEPAVVVRRD